MVVLRKTKRCPNCCLVKAAYEYYYNRQNCGRLSSYCKSCVKIRSKQWQRDNPLKKARQQALYRQKIGYKLTERSLALISGLPALTDEGATQPVSGQGRADVGGGRKE